MVHPQRRCVLGPMVLTSDFDSGNMGKVELLDEDELVSLDLTYDVEMEYCILYTVLLCNSMYTICILYSIKDRRYIIDVAPDCAGSPYENTFKRLRQAIVCFLA